MKWIRRKQNKYGTDKGFPLLLSMILVFCILGAVVFSVSWKISREILKKEAEFQKLMAQEIAEREEPEEYVRSYRKNQTMVKIAFIRAGETEGISSTGEVFSEEGLDFSSGGVVDGLLVSHSYLNYMGTWAYIIIRPVEK